MQISGIRALVTGGGSGIGLATIKTLLQAGAGRIGLLARREEKIATALGSIESAEQQARVIPLLADVRDGAALKEAFARFVEQAGGLEVLVNNAGILRDGPLVAFSFRGITRYPFEEWQDTLATNLTGVFLCAQLAAEQMYRQRSRGVIINISSLSRQGRAGQVAYSASKGGIASLTFTLAQELAPCQIRVAAIAPGLVDTPMAAQIPAEHRQRMLAGVAVRRMGTAEEIAHGVRFCIENDFFNGRVLELDGGAFGQ